MKIRKLHLEQVGVFDSLTIEFPEKKAKNKAEIHILTGVNGSGKSTILYALANGFNFQIDDKILNRFRNGKSIVEITNNTGRISKYNKAESRWNFFTDMEEYQDSYLFAYSGSRSLNSVELEGIKELKTNPFENSLSFDMTTNSKDLSQWIANSITREALASIDGNKKEAKKYTNSIKKIEKIVSEIVNFNIQFILEREFLSVKLKVKDKILEFDVLPDGLKSIVSWIANLLMRMDRIKWVDDRDIFDREFILFLDEIDIHLHPAWQRKILPVIQKLFKNSQIFVSTHSPFVVGSVSDAYVYELDVKDGKGYLKNREESKAGFSYSYVLDEVFGIDERFDIETEAKFDEFYKIKDEILKRKEIDKKSFLNIAENLAKKSEQVNNIVVRELRQLSRITGEEFDL